VAFDIGALEFDHGALQWLAIFVFDAAFEGRNLSKHRACAQQNPSGQQKQTSQLGEHINPPLTRILQH
jgi:hypothetical protein